MLKFIKLSIIFVLAFLLILKGVSILVFEPWSVNEVSSSYLYGFIVGKGIAGLIALLAALGLFLHFYEGITNPTKPVS